VCSNAVSATEDQLVVLRFKIHSKPDKSDELMAAAGLRAPCERRSMATVVAPAASSPVPRVPPPSPHAPRYGGCRLTAAAPPACGGGGASSSSNGTRTHRRPRSASAAPGVGDVLMDSQTKHTSTSSKRTPAPRARAPARAPTTGRRSARPARPAAGAGAKASLIGTIKRSTGRRR